MRPEDKKKHDRKLLWIWIALLVMIFVFATHDACEVRKDNPELEENAYFLSCSSE